MRQPCQPPPPGSPPSTCDVCASGCECPPDGPGCGHYGCYGRAPHTCPGVAAEEARYAAQCAARRAEDARTLNRRASLAAAYGAAVAATQTTRRMTR